MFFVNFLKIFGTFLFLIFYFILFYFIFFFWCAGRNFLKVDKNTGEKIFAKYLSADGCFVKTILLTVMITTMLSVPDTRAFAVTRQPMKRNLIWSTRAIHLRGGTAFLFRLKFWFAKKIKINLLISPTDTSCCKLSRPCKNFCCFQKMMQLFNLMLIMLFA